MNNKNNKHWESYGVFCIATTLMKNTRELDVAWEEAISLFEEFLLSDYNNLNESELDCINAFLAAKTTV